MFLLPIVAMCFWWIPFAFEVDQVVGYDAPIYGPLDRFLTQNLIVRNLIALTLVLTTAIILNRALNRYELYRNTTYLPALVYVLISSMYGFQLALSPAIFANLFLVLALIQLLGIYRQESAKTRVFNAGFLLSIATMFFIPAAFALPVIFMTLVIIRPFVWREWAFALIGFTLPQLFAAGALIATQTPLPEFNIIIDPELIDRIFVGQNDIVGLVLWSAVIFMVLVSIFHVLKVRTRATNRKRRLISMFAWYSILLYVAYLFSCMNDDVVSRFGIMMLPLTMLFSFALVEPKNRVVPFVVFYVILGATIVNYYFYLSGS